MRWPWRRDERVFLTHSPGGFEVGQIVQWRDDYPRFRVTRLVPLAPTGLITGGSAPCYEVRGVRVD